MTGFVYVIQSKTGGPVKVGYSGNPELRLTQLQNAHHDELAVMRTFAGSHFDESALHERIADHSIRGEWYADHPDIWEVFESVRAATAIRRVQQKAAAAVEAGIEGAARAAVAGDWRHPLDREKVDAIFREAASDVADALDELLATVLQDARAAA